MASTALNHDRKAQEFNMQDYNANEYVPADANEEPAMRMTGVQDLRKEYFENTTQHVRNTLQTGFLENVEERPSEVNPSVFQASLVASPINMGNKPHGIRLNDIGLEENDDVIVMGKFQEATGGDLDQIEQHLTESMQDMSLE